jgi:hypothetical protein
MIASAFQKRTERANEKYEKKMKKRKNIKIMRGI